MSGDSRDQSLAKWVTIGLVLACVGVVAAEFFHPNDHPHFEAEKWPAFQAVFGFVAFVVIVFLGRLLRPLVSRDESYYQRHDLPEPRTYADEARRITPETRQSNAPEDAP